MKKRSTGATAARSQMSDLQWRFLKGEPLPKTFEALILRYNIGNNVEELWNLHKDVILAEHIKENPGTRPALFWQYDAPRSPVGTYPGTWVDGTLPRPRERLGGTGTPAHECGAVMPSFSFGLPDIWVGMDEDDLPIYESQAAYLKRHGLLFAGEERRADYEPEAVPTSWDWFPGRTG